MNTQVITTTLYAETKDELRVGSQLVGEMVPFLTTDHLPIATEIQEAQVVSHNKYLGNLFKKIYSYTYIMNMDSFIKVIRTGPREVSKNSVITYTRNLNRLAADIDAIGDVDNDWDNGNSFTENLAIDVVGTSLQMGIQLLSDNSAMLTAMSNSVRKARIAALLVGIDPERSNKATESYSTRKATFAEKPSLFMNANHYFGKYKGKYPKYGDHKRYWEYVMGLEDDADNKYKDEVDLNTKAKIIAFKKRDENHDDGVHHSHAYREEDRSVPGRSLAYLTPETFWTGEYRESFNEYESPVLAQVIMDLRDHAVKEQNKYQASAKIKSVKEDKNWVSQEQIVGKAKEMATKFNEIFRKKDLTIPSQARVVAHAKKIGKLIKTERAEAKAAMEEYKKLPKEEQKLENQPMVAFKEKWGLPKSQFPNTRKLKKGLIKAYWALNLPKTLTNKPFMSALINAFVAALYTEMPPRRLDWAKLHFISKSKWDKMEEDQVAQDGGFHDAIYYVYPPTQYGVNPGSSKSFIVFGARAGKSAQADDLRVDDIGINIRKFGSMIYWISRMKNPEDMPNGRPVIVTNPGFKQIDENALGKRVKKIFSGKYGGIKKNITAGLLRKIFITSEFQGDTEKKVRIAKLMNHSVKIQQAIYNKEAGNEYEGIAGTPMTGEDLNQVESNQIPVDEWTKKHLHKSVVE